MARDLKLRSGDIEAMDGELMQPTINISEDMRKELLKKDPKKYE